MPIVEPSGDSGGGGGGSVTSVTAADTSVVVAGTAADPTIRTGTLDVIAADHPPAANWSNNAKKITALANGSAAQDAAAFGQIPTSLPTTQSLDQIAVAHVTAADWSNNSHKITSVLDPTGAQDAATKNYVDTAIAGLDWKQAARLASATALPANVYVNGASGVGATLTGSAFGALSVDGTAVAVNDRVLVKNEVAGSHNGIYLVTATGGGAALYVLTRTTDYNQTSEIQAGDAVYVTEGTANVDTSWVMTTTGVITVGTTALTFTQFGGNLVTSVFGRTGAVVAASNDYTLNQVGAATGDYSLNSHKITSLAVATAATDAASLANTLDTFGAPAANVGWNSKKITSLANGTAASDAAAFGQIPTGLADPLAVALGYVNWSMNPGACSGTSTFASGTVAVVALWLPYGKVITNIVCNVGIAAAGGNPTGFFVGLAGPTGTMVAQSNNQNASAQLTALGMAVLPLNATYTTASGDSSTGMYYVVLLQNGSWGTTQPAFNRGSSLATAGAANGANPVMTGTGATTGQTALPANGSGIVGGLVNTSSRPWFVSCS